MPDVVEQFEGQLYQIELVVTHVFDDHPDLTDAQVDSVYEELSRRYRAEATAHEFKAGKLDGIRADLHAELLPVTELLLGRPANMAPADPISAEDMRLCLNRLRSSIKRWSREGGRQGYLTYLSEYL